MKGIVLAGGMGTRLYPLTEVVCKQLLPVYDKPMLYYPVSTLMLAGIKDILIISTPKDLPTMESMLGDGSQLGIKLSYAVQPEPEGLAQAFIIGEKFIGDDDVCLILGDNLFYGAGLSGLLNVSKDKVEQNREAVNFGYWVQDPERYGVAEIDSDNKILSIVEKPNVPKSNYAVVGLYFYPNDVIKVAKNVKPSERGILEITSVNQEYLKENRLNLQVLSRGFAWLDTGTHEALSEATEFVKAIEKRTSLKISCLEEIAYRMKYISLQQLEVMVKEMPNSGYKRYLQRIVSLEK